MVLEEYYNEKTKTLTIPYKFNEKLKELPFDTKIIIFKEDIAMLLTHGLSHSTI